MCTATGFAAARALLCRRAGPLLRARLLAPALFSALVVPAVAATAPPVDPALLEVLQALHYDGRVKPDGMVSRWATFLPQLTARPDLQIDALISLGLAQAVVNDAAGVERVADQLGALAQASGPPTASWARTAAAVVRAELLRRQGPVGRADRLLSDALAGLTGDVPPTLRHRFVAMLALLKETAGNFEPAVRLYQEAIALAEASGAPVWQRAELRSRLALSLLLAGHVDRARQVNDQTLAQARAAGHDLALFLAHVTAGVIAAELDLSAAKAATLAALDYARHAGAERDEVRATANLADMALRRADYSEALAYSERALPVARRLLDVDSQSVALANIGFAHIMLGRKDEGLRHARASLALDEQTGSLASTLLTHTELSEYLERAGFLADAYVERREQRRLSELLFRRDQQQAVIELQEAFEHGQRQRSLALLETEGRVQQAQLVTRQLQQSLWAAGAAIGAALLVLGTLLARRVRAGNEQLARANAQLSELSERDALTGLANRRHFQAALHSRGGNESLQGTLMLIDIDHFKLINDRFGHAVGDIALVEVARRLRLALRDDDLIVRWGGEEFLLLVRTVRRAEVDALVERLLHAIAALPVSCGAQRVPVSASIGFASFPLERALLALPIEQAVDLVDTAMYLAKASGRHRAYGLRRADAVDAQALMLLSRDLEAAARAGQVELTAIVGPAAEPLMQAAV